MENITLADKILHQQFIKIGSDRRKLTNELLALLPGIYERSIYRKYAASIVEYAGKFGGLSKNVVLKRLRLEKYLESKPLLKEAIKTEGVHKVALVASIATAETEAIWVDKLKNMSKAAIQELSKEVRSKNELDGTEKLSCKAVPLRLKIELDEELTGLFLKFKKKFGKNLNNAEIMKKIFEVALDGKSEFQKSACAEAKKAEIDKLQSVEVVPGDRDSQSEFRLNFRVTKSVTRYIPAKIKKHILEKSNNQCSYPSCNKPAEIFHHANRFAVNKSHESLTTLCGIHHEFAHNGLIDDEAMISKNWQLSFGEKLSEIDQHYRNSRRRAILMRHG